MSTCHAPANDQGPGGLGQSYMPIQKSLSKVEPYDTRSPATKAKSPAAISSANGGITWGFRPKRCGASRTVGSYFALPAFYRRRRSRTPCTAMTTTSWFSALPSRKTRTLLPSASVGSGCLTSPSWLQCADEVSLPADRLFKSDSECECLHRRHCLRTNIMQRRLGPLGLEAKSIPSANCDGRIRSQKHGEICGR
jgi:hypothetical protein